MYLGGFGYYLKNLLEIFYYSSQTLWHDVFLTIVSYIQIYHFYNILVCFMAVLLLRHLNE
jgi:hypothetical protein